MEPVDYLKILRNHWKAVALLVIVAVGVAYAITPAEASHTYTAGHVLEVRTDVVAEGVQGPASVVWASDRVDRGDMLARAGEFLEWEGGYEELSEMVTATPDSDFGTLTITATASDPDVAVQVANAFGAAWIDHVAERENADGESLSDEDAMIRVAEIETALDRDPDRADAPDLRAEMLDLERQLSGDSLTGSTEYVTLEEAREADQATAMFASRNQRMPLFGVIALVLGFGVAMLLDRSDSRIRTKEQAEKRFGLPVLAEVPLLSLRDRGRAAVAAYEREPRLAEAYRSLRTALLLVRGDGLRRGDDAALNGNGQAGRRSGRRRGGGPGEQSPDRQLVVVTSAEPGEGKSTTAANLALAYAEAGHSVLILTWDLWRPINPSVFGAGDGSGLSDYIEDDGPPLVHYVQETSIPGVNIVTAGTLHGQPSPRPQTTRRLLDEARGLAGVVVVDTAPLLSASVTRELATLADAVVVACRAGRTTAEAADRCAELFERTDAPALGVVLVGVGTGAFSDYYGPARKAGYDRSAAAPSRRRATPAGGTAGVSRDSGASGVPHPGEDTEEIPMEGWKQGRHLRPDGGSGGFRASSSPGGTGRSPGGS